MFKTSASAYSLTLLLLLSFTAVCTCSKASVSPRDRDASVSRNRHFLTCIDFVRPDCFRIQGTSASSGGWWGSHEWPLHVATDVWIFPNFQYPETSCPDIQMPVAGWHPYHQVRRQFKTAFSRGAAESTHDLPVSLRIPAGDAVPCGSFATFSTSVELFA